MTSGPSTTESLALLREAVLRLTQHAVRDSPTAAPTVAPTRRLTKLGPDNDVEAYLEMLERTARRESWPEGTHDLATDTPPGTADCDLGGLRC